MSVEWNRFWCRVLFKEFIKHFRKLNDEQIVKDVRQSMDDLEDFSDELQELSKRSTIQNSAALGA